MQKHVKNVMHCSQCRDTDPVDLTQRFGGKELNFRAPVELAEGLRARAAGRLDADPHAAGGDPCRVTSLSVDAPEFEIFRRLGSFARGKFQVRQYHPAPVEYLGRKLKPRPVVCHRRSRGDLSGLRWTGALAARKSEASRFSRRLSLRRLEPVCSISSLCAARVATEDGAASRGIFEVNWRVEMRGQIQEPPRTCLLEWTPMSKSRRAVAAPGLAEVHA
jgi:hypothetical protein